MGVTFMLPHEFRTVTREEEQHIHSQPCPDCGGHDRYATMANRIEADRDCTHCYGDGGNTDAVNAHYMRRSVEDGEFGVANANAVYIVQELLNLPDTEVYGGSIEPHIVLARLALVFNTSSAVIAPSEDQTVMLTEHGVGLGCKVYNAGRSQAQCDSYVTRLQRLAEIAVERSAPEIQWG